MPQAKRPTTPVPIVDLFAGPGGLGEGFSALGRPEGDPRFKIVVSIEKDAIAHQTLELRAFFRQFAHGRAPEAYYDYLRDPTLAVRKALFDVHPKEAEHARS
jgi:DNA (cytosine-5)-methyltransferase 1